MADTEAFQGMFRSLSSVIANQHSGTADGGGNHMAIQVDDGRVESKAIISNLRDFWWDKVILAMILLILGVTGVQTFGSFLSSDEVKCLIEENATMNEEQYVNQLCTGATPIHLYGRSIIYFAVALLSGTQLFWTMICNGRIESFKSTVSSMSLKRNPKTGLFEASDLESARFLESQLSSRILTCSYFLFKFVQLCLCVPGIVVPLFLFEVDMGIAFVCRRKAFKPRQWPLSASEIYCAYEEIASLQLLRWVNTAALLVIVLTIICGLSVLIYRFHSLDHKQIALFLLRTGLKRKHYELSFRDKTSWKKICCACKKTNETNRRRDLASWDMMFLTLLLHESNKKLGEALLSCLISFHLDFLAECACAERHKGTDHIVIEDQDMIDGGHHYYHNHLEKTIKALVQRAKLRSTRRPYGILLTNWNDSLAYLHSVHFEGMICINFNSSITDKSACVFQRNHRTNMIPIYHTPSHLWSWTYPEESISKKIDSGIADIISTLCKKPDHPIMILLAPLSDEVYNVQHLELRVRNLLWCLHKNATLQKHVTFVSVISPTSVKARDLAGDHVQSEGERTWWLKAGTSSSRVPSENLDANAESGLGLLIEGKSAITDEREDVKYEYSYSLYRVNFPEAAHENQAHSNNYTCCAAPAQGDHGVRNNHERAEYEEATM